MRRPFIAPPVLLGCALSAAIAGCAAPLRPAPGPLANPQPPRFDYPLRVGDTRRFRGRRMEFNVILDDQRGPGRLFVVRRGDGRPAEDRGHARALALTAALNLFDEDACRGRSRLSPLRVDYDAQDGVFLVTAECRS